MKLPPTVGGRETVKPCWEGSNGAGVSRALASDGELRHGGRFFFQVLLDRFRLLRDGSVHFPDRLRLGRVGRHGVLPPRGLLLVRGAGRPHAPVVCRGPNVQLVLAEVRPRAAGVQRGERGRNGAVRGQNTDLLPAAPAAAGFPLQVTGLGRVDVNEPFIAAVQVRRRCSWW